MELRSIGAYIGTLVFLAVTIPFVQLTEFEDNFCEDASSCSLGVEGCSLVQCDCPGDERSYCAETDKCGPSCALSKLDTASCCDFIPEQFHSPEVIHVLHIAVYTNVISDNSDEEFYIISVWSALNDSIIDDWKLLRVNILNMTSWPGTVPSVVAISDALALMVNQTILDFPAALLEITETVPMGTSLERGLTELTEMKSCHKNLPCEDDVILKCQCHQCMKTTKTILRDEICQNVSMPDGFYITDIGNHHAESIGVSSMLTTLHAADNSIDEWAEGTVGGWAPMSTDTNMFMAFHNLRSNVCGIAIQGMAASTYRSLELFKISASNDTFLDDEGHEIMYKSGVMLDSKSFHYFPEPVPMSSCLQLEVIQPLNATRVGFRAGLIGCSNKLPPSRDPDVCTIAEELISSITNKFPDIEKTQSLVTDENPSGVSVALFNFIQAAINMVDAIPEEEFDVKVNADGIGSKIYLSGVQSQKLASNGYTFDNSIAGVDGGGWSSQDGPSGNDGRGSSGNETSSEDGSLDDSDGGQSGSVQSPVSVTVPKAAFERLTGSNEGTSFVLIAVVVIEANENATNVEIGDNDYVIASSIIQINTFTRNATFELTELNYTVVVKNITTDSSPVCAFFEEENSKVSEPVEWSMDGCSRISDDESLPKVTCYCNHTTSYAVLLQVGVTNYSEIWGQVQSIVSMVGLAISIAALTVALLIYFFLRANISSARYAIHSNLMVALLLTSIIFVSGILETTIDVLCYICKYLLQYLIMATFCWMLAEGMHLYRQIITVFESERKQNWLYFVVGWALPLVFVGIAFGFTMMSPIESSDNICFFSAVDGSVWLVVGPVLVIIVLNMLVLLRVTLIVVKAVRFQAEKEASETIMQVKAGLRSALLLMPLLGSTYLLSIVTHYSPVIELAYNVVNSLQGFFIALFYCALNTEVRTAISQYIRRSRETSTVLGSTTGLKGVSEAGKSKGLFTKKNRVSPNQQTQFTFTTASQSTPSSDNLIPVT